MPTISSAAFVALATGVTVATIVDLRSRRIPNALTAAMAGVGIGFAAAGVTGLSPMASIVGFCVGLLLMLPGHALGATGAGDVKLMAAIGAIVGPALIVTVFLFTAIAGGVLALIVAVRRRQLAEALSGTARIIVAPGGAPKELRVAAPTRRFAYGPAIAAGSLLAALVG